ncbi:isocitrate/isopropylmalate family dehydrogenase, partial [Algiphilus sp.]|uniref:isocitrate/isopropylmalate family dehydrogenase n=1 Tax=Algiphilus sp. TaxID=1872431 RepID=UPI003C598613
MTAKLLLLPGDGIGPEVVGEAERVLAALRDGFGFDASWEHGLIGGAAIDAENDPLPAATL